MEIESLRAEPAFVICSKNKEKRRGQGMRWSYIELLELTAGALKVSLELCVVFLQLGVVPLGLLMQF